MSQVPGVSEEAFQKQVEAFCLYTGGGIGSYFGPEQCFAMGVKCARIGGFDVDGNARGGMNLFVPAGFAGGRELPPPPVSSRGDDFRTFVEPHFVQERKVAFGRISWDANINPSCYVRVPVKEVCAPTRSGEARLQHGASPPKVPAGSIETWANSSEGFGALPDLLRFFCERVWRLKRPKLLISVCGSSEDCDIQMQDRQALLSGVMQLANETDAWIVTNGLDVGVSKLIGQAKQSSELKSPLIGIVPWGVVEGRQALWDKEADGSMTRHVDRMIVEGFTEHEKTFARVKPHGQKSVRLSREHSHFILLDDGTKGELRGEAAIRARFESSVESGGNRVIEDIRRTVEENNLGWQATNMHRREGAQSVTTVCVVIEGGPGTVHKVYEAVTGGTAVLLCRGTGKTADVLSDACEYVEAGNLDLYLRQHHEEDHRSSSEGEEDGDEGRHARHMDEDPLERLSSVYSKSKASDVGVNNKIIERMLINDSEDEWLQADVQKFYDVKYPGFDKIVAMVTAIARSGLCQIYTVASLNNGVSDLPGAMLVAALKKQRMMGKAWRDCLGLVVAWNHVGIMRQLLNHVKSSELRTRTALEEAFHRAFSENKVEMAKTLLMHWDCSAVYNFNRKEETSGIQIFNSMRINAKSKKEEVAVIRNWTDLVVKMLNSTKAAAKSALHNWAELSAIAAEEDEPRKLFEVRQNATWQEIFSMQTIEKIQAYLVPPDESTEVRRVSPMENIRAFERVYKDVLGEDWWYEMSTLGSLMDLFLFSLLMCRQPMAKMLWARLDVPVRSALLAATWYRKWAARSGVKVHVMTSMLQYADEFEDMAVQVQRITMRNDSRMALEALERPSRLWKGQTGVDLAILGNCRKFIETCCVEALDCRWTGDLSPYRQTLGLYPTVVLNILSVGLLTPHLVSFRMPAQAEALKAPTQKRKVPLGFDARALASGSENKTAAANDKLFFKLQMFQVQFLCLSYKYEIHKP